MRLRSPFFLRLLISSLLLLALGMGLVGVLGATRIRATYLAGKEESLRNEARLLASLVAEDLGTPRASELGERLAALGRQLACRITVVGDDGIVLADNEADPERMENHRLRPEIVGAAAQGEGVSVRLSHTVGQEMLYLAVRSPSARRPAFFVRLAVPLEALDAHLSKLYADLAGAAALALLIAALFAFYFTRRYTRPLSELTLLAEAYARGEFERRIHSREGGELGVLARALNAMADAQAGMLARIAKDREELLAIVAGMSEGLIATDGEQRVLLVNGAAASLFDLELEKARGRPLWELVRDDAVAKAAAEVLAGAEGKAFTLGPVRGRHLEVRVGAISVRGRPDGLILLAHDVSEALRYEELRKEFVANVSHELRTPLTLIKGFVETLRDGALRDATKAPEFLATIERHVDRLANLVSDLLELSRLDAPGEAGLQREPVDVGEAVRRAADLLGPAAERRRQRLEVEVGPGLPPVLGVAHELERAIANLLDNAIKYSSEGGNVRLRASSGAGGGRVEIEVSDDGIGIPAEDLPRVFERFYRVDKSRSREMGGTGLGLAIVKHVAQLHGGTAHVTSAPGRGSTFSLRLPAVPEAPDSPAPPASDPVTPRT
ncbi:MAG: PAS domain-containing protein [Planctomycetes bacterium]|nr:PAS domain-containing protein [Planctomycetota bacterium]